MSETARTLAAEVAAVNDILCAVAVLQWDNRTVMPAGGAETRGQQIATLKGLARERILSGAMRRAAEQALAETEGREERDLERRAASQVLAAIRHHERLDPRLLQRQAELGPVAGAAWAEARAASDFASFLPFLAESVALARESAEAMGHDGHPYSAMVALYEPGETADSIKRFLDELRAGLLPILDRARGRPRDALVDRLVPVEAQRAACRGLAELVGYDFGRGRLDTAVHPFEISFTRNDVRITTRYREDFLPGALFGTLHEAGHGLYEQNVAEALTRSVFATDLILLYAVGGTSFGAHESQSRLWENHVGRSEAFWRLNLSRLQGHFPGALDDVSPERFARAVNHVEPGFIRVDADELTYDFHIMLRAEIERQLMDGSLAPADLPGAWNEAMRRDLGLTVPDDRRGCLQDVHWSSGYLGSFPTYTVGNAMAAQLMESLHAGDPELGERLAAGDYARLAGHLREAVWRHGRSRSRDELLVDATGSALTPGPYLRYLAAKFG
ncbi:carboxypeptidase M32 [Aureimonas jatrophae]|uniref:Metal-dependent carboxypeptidase n=1 Tax=Aureimonas jatrophae TaxID=1166073 RepID=A0A1H0HHX3_9HYPH|nr:carboxypeptidase M32 [Aureimonas jatrophae]MBB3950601.1 carboxypeptidase Taq [Aureimonas jatrophae]SDO18809.1 carboxypeptidase Taq [Aureimonas jatrophae]